ncbi:MAG: hypothetical protein FJW36_11410 [Acidobacteria bacterium]|nr:hypothetical protein [Acidobacteriota bacterium]
MYRVFLLTLVIASCLQAATQEETLQRIRDLEARLERAEALIRQLMEARTPSLETPAPASAPEVRKSETAIAPDRMPQELLPNLGLIGATSSFSAGTHSGPYSSARGNYFAGSVSLPLAKAPAGQLLYEFSAGLSQSSTNLNVTSNVAQVANLAVLGPGLLNDALRGTGAAPFPVQIQTKSDIDLLQVVPFALKYQTSMLNRWRLRPYVIAGLGLYVTISNQNSLTGLRPDANLPAELRAALNALFGNGAPFGGSLIGGQITAARELTALGIPSGQGGITPGFQTGGGIEWRMRPRFSWGLDLRWNKLSNGANFYTIAPRGSFHF